MSPQAAGIIACSWGIMSSLCPTGCLSVLLFVPCWQLGEPRCLRRSRCPCRWGLSCANMDLLIGSQVHSRAKID